ncbi:MAG: tetratricopeptide repeat protein [Rhodanobacter sp.]
MPPHSSAITPDVQSVADKAIRLHQQGQLAEAENLFMEVIQRAPAHAEALRLLGVIALQTGRPAQGLALIERSLVVAPDNPTSHSNRGAALCDLLRFDEAITSLDRAIALKSDYASAYSNRGIAYGRLGRFDEAVDSYQRAIAINPNQVDAHSNLGAALFQLGRFEEAVASCDRALMLRPELPTAYNNRGKAFMSLERFTEALADFNQAIALNQDFVEAHRGLADALHALGRMPDAIDSYAQAVSLDPRDAMTWSKYADALCGLARFDEAIHCYDEVIALQPEFMAAHCNRGGALLRLHRFAEALDSLDLALAIQPDIYEALGNRGHVLLKLGRLEEAETSSRQALELRPEDAEAHGNLAGILCELGRYEEAMASSDTAIELKPECAGAHSNRAMALQELHRIEEAAASFARCTSLDPGHVDGQHNRSMFELRIGQFEPGWPRYEWRKKMPGVTQLPAKTTWTGREDVVGKTVLLYAEQGLGDTLQFIRYAKLMRERGARVVVAVQAPLLSLLKQWEPEIEFTTLGLISMPIDFHCALMSLPLALGTRLETIPASPRYLVADATMSEQWAHRLGTKARPRIGLAWSGNTANKIDHKRSMPLRELEPLLAFPADWYVVQKGIRPTDTDVLAQLPQVTDFGAGLGDFAKTAALMDQLDLIISVDTSLAHLAGALGKPVWIMLPRIADWRWLLDREDSPWYPSARLFRQSARNDWASVVAQMRKVLITHTW